MGELASELERLAREQTEKNSTPHFSKYGRSVDQYAVSEERVDTTHPLFGGYHLVAEGLLEGKKVRFEYTEDVPMKDTVFAQGDIGEGIAGTLWNVTFKGCEFTYWENKKEVFLANLRVRIRGAGSADMRTWPAEGVQQYEILPEGQELPIVVESKLGDYHAMLANFVAAFQVEQTRPLARDAAIKEAGKKYDL